MREEVQANDKLGEHAPDSAPHIRGEKWALTQKAFDDLMQRLSSDRDEAARMYERLRLRLVRFFEWRVVEAADECADETLDRVARRLDEGEEVDDITAYAYGVARRLLKERIRNRKAVSVDLDSARDVPASAVVEQPEDDRLLCFDRCLENLPVEKRTLIIGYYQEQRRAKIERRSQLAERLSIPLNALRIRVHRIRLGLESCVNQCVKLKDR